MPRQILLADDSLTIARMVQITFAHEDYEVVVAHTADEALSRARMQRPDIALVDARLADKNGYELCAELRAAAAGLPVLLLASNQAPYDEERGRQAGSVGSVVKPFDTQALIDRVAQVIAEQGAAVVAPASNEPSDAIPLVTVAPTPPPAPPTLRGFPASDPAQLVPPSIPAAPVAPTPPAVPSAAPAPAPVVAPLVPPMPAATRHDTGTFRVGGRATIMGLPTVGADGLPVAVKPPEPSAAEAPIAPSVTPPAVARPAVPPVIAPPFAPPSAPHAPLRTTIGIPSPMAHASKPHVTPPVAEPEHPALASVVPTPIAEEKTPVAGAGAATLLEMPAPSLPREATRPFVESRSPTPTPAPPAAPIVVAAAPARAAIPSDAPRMPRPSLVPNAPLPAVLRKLVQSVAEGQSALGQPLGPHPEYEAIARLSREVIEQIAWEVVPELAEQILRKQVERRAAELVAPPVKPPQA